MNKEFKYQGVSQEGKQISGIVNAKNEKGAKYIINQISEKHKFRISKVTKKKEWLYYIKMANGKKQKGRQGAFSKEELKEALVKNNYEVIKIEPVLLDINIKPSFQKIMMFIQLSAFMLEEKMSFDKILALLADEEEDRVLKDTLKRIQSELKKGKEGVEVFAQFSHVFGKFPAFMLGLATKSGNMAEIYKATGKFMERDLEYRKSLRQALAQPMFMVVLTLGALGYYVMDIFPKTALIFVKMGIDVPPLTKWTLDTSEYLGKNWWWMLLAIITPIVTIFFWWRTKKGQIWRDRFLIKIPVLGKLLHKTSIEIFFRVFAAIYSGSENNIETLKASAEACKNKYIEEGIKVIAIPLMLREGYALIPALDQADVFNRSTLSRLRSGTETGNILMAAHQISRFYEKETTYKMTGLIESVQSYIGMFIGAAITFLTVVSAEIATVQPPSGM